ncbi:MAG: hypothetical protein E7672_08010 [Ruminococcaceae bacterium]|nr:hypothetical protein [Oscillospiraceae bacterium]
MRSIYDNYTKLETDGRITFFAGANTPDGFVGSYKDIVNESTLERVYIIKGGSGTGKSTLMRKIADAAESEGFISEYYLCGSDPHSLDCVVIDGRIAILDGTAPHTLDMKYPGASSDLIDVSKFWSNAVLEQNREKIIYHSAYKSSCYASAYRYLSAARAVENEKIELADKLFDHTKALAYIERFLRGLKPKKSHHIYLREEGGYDHALTMRGKYMLPTLSEIAENNYYVQDSFSLAVPFMNMLRSELIRRGFLVKVTRMPCEHSVSGIFIKDSGLSITVGEKKTDDKCINMSRFIVKNPSSELKGQMRLAAKCAESCMDEALERLHDASLHHFALEEIYKKAMDFDALEKNTEKVCLEILSRIRVGRDT